MNTGMLWFDNSKIPLAEKIKKAFGYYVKKYDKRPDLVLINPSMGDAEVEGVTVRHFRPVLPGHICIGMEDKESTTVV